MSIRKMFIALITVLLLTASIAAIDAWKASAQGPNGTSSPCGSYASGWDMRGSMMGDWDNEHGMMSHHNMMGGSMMQHEGMMGDWDNEHGMMNHHNMMGDDMMGGWTPPAELGPEGTSLSLEEAQAVAEACIASQNNANLALGEVIPFNNYFYAQAVEVDSARGAFEFVINAANGTVYPEMGPNMMWNLRYGMHAGSGMMMQWNVPAGADGTDMTVTPEQALTSAQQFVDTSYSGLTVADQGSIFYGYYTFKVLEGENIVGILSVNGYTGQVWRNQ